MSSAMPDRRRVSSYRRSTSRNHPYSQETSSSPYHRYNNDSRMSRGYADRYSDRGMPPSPRIPIGTAGGSPAWSGNLRDQPRSSKAFYASPDHHHHPDAPLRSTPVPVASSSYDNHYHRGNAKADVDLPPRGLAPSWSSGGGRTPSGGYAQDYDRGYERVYDRRAPATGAAGYPLVSRNASTRSRSPIPTRGKNDLQRTNDDNGTSNVIISL